MSLGHGPQPGRRSSITKRLTHGRHSVMGAVRFVAGGSLGAVIGPFSTFVPSTGPGATIGPLFNSVSSTGLGASIGPFFRLVSGPVCLVNSPPLLPISRQMLFLSLPPPGSNFSKRNPFGQLNMQHHALVPVAQDSPKRCPAIWPVNCAALSSLEAAPEKTSPDEQAPSQNGAVPSHRHLALGVRSAALPGEIPADEGKKQRTGEGGEDAHHHFLTRRTSDYCAARSRQLKGIKGHAEPGLNQRFAHIVARGVDPNFGVCMNPFGSSLRF